VAAAFSLLLLAASGAGAPSFPEVQALLKTYCVQCHQGKAPAAKLNLSRFRTIESVRDQPRVWNRMLVRVRNGEMPPQGKPAPAMKQREAFVAWVESTLRTAACADGILPGRAPLRRLNRSEYAATVRDLLNVHFNAGHALPADGAGGEGFDNAAETLFLSPVHAEKYLEAAKQALEYGAKDSRARARFLIAEPDAQTSPEQAARKILEAFLPRAFRRPAREGEVERYLALFRGSQGRGGTFDDSILFALQGVLISPHFLFRLEEPNPHKEPRPLGDYELATRLSYFLWGSMPDDTLFDLAAKGKLGEDGTLNEQVARMLKDVRAREFAERFTEQWLGTRELGRDIKPDRALFPMYHDPELQSAIRYEPILFLQEILAENLSLLNLLDSKFTILTNKLQRHYGLEVKGLTQSPKRAELPENSHRGGVLGMAAVLAVSSYPQRTSPVLRGKWILDALLGTPPPAPPPNVPELKEEHAGDAPQTLRERLLQHRQSPGCASCHNRIDPLGFALENYDVLGRWRTEDAGKPLDSKGELPDGTIFDGPDQLKAVLLERKDGFLRHLTTKMLGYALGRGLTYEEYCTVDRIVEQLPKEEYRAHTLVQEIVRSVPFRYVEAAP
jgi:mono/diheme cytochrome c family protein